MSKDNEKLIEEAARAIRDADNDFDFNARAGHREQDARWLRAMASAALAVFEKVHAPTDDERALLADWLRAGAPFDSETWGQYQDQLDNAASAIEAIRSPQVPTDERGDLIGAASAAFKNRGGAPEWEEDAIARDLIIRWHLRGFEDGLASRFRRSEIPEPSAKKLEWPDHWTTNEKLRDLHARWHDQKGNLIEVCEWEACEFWDAAKFTLRLADVRIAGRDPQGEPSDAQVYECRQDRACSFGSHSVECEEENHAALRAASAVTEQGE